MAYSALEPRARRAAPQRRVELRSLHPAAAPERPAEDRMQTPAPRPRRVTAIYPPGYRPQPRPQPRPTGLTRTALPPAVAQREEGWLAPAPTSTPQPATLPATPEMELPPELKKHVRLVRYRGPGPLVGRVYEIPGWLKWSQTARLRFMRAFAEDKARDPHIAQTATAILRAANCDGRDLRRGWAVLLRWCQDHITYVNEPAERIQSPQATLQLRFGDCDDLAILLLALGHALRWPARWVLSGRDRKSGRKVRWIEGQSEPSAGVDWAHIYLMVGGPPFRPAWWVFAEPTLKVPLGWDVVAATGDQLPEMSGPTRDLGLPGLPAAAHLGDASAPAAPMLTLPASTTVVPSVNRAVAVLKGIAWLNLVTAAIPPIFAAWFVRRYIMARRR
ncbi:MAG: hypothetical protein EXR31_10450 [Betaproteobacteria bacterium]|nr:hypothetical protein [Betaproteobacteria bacterium]